MKERTAQIGVLCRGSRGRRPARWLGLIAAIGGGGARFMGVSGFLDLPVPGVLFNLFAFTVTLWVLVTGMLLWHAPAGLKTNIQPQPMQVHVVRGRQPLAQWREVPRQRFVGVEYQ